MKNLLLLLVLGAISLFAQTVQHVIVDPTIGTNTSCVGVPILQYNPTTGHLFTCVQTLGWQQSSNNANPSGVVHSPNCTAVVTSTFETCVFGGDITNSGSTLTVVKIQGVTVTGTTGTGNSVLSISPTFTGAPAIAAATGTSVAVTTFVSGATYNTATNCTDSAGAAACGSAASGSFVIDASATATVVSTSAVTANSIIILQNDSSLGSRLSVTCNTQSSLVLGAPRVTARSASTSFTATIEVGPTTDPMCLNYWIIN